MNDLFNDNNLRLTRIEAKLDILLERTKPKQKRTQVPQGRFEYPKWFELMWSNYPKRCGNRNKWGAYKAAEKQTRSEQDDQVWEMQQGTVKYAKWCEATGKVNTEFVMMAAT